MPGSSTGRSSFRTALYAEVPDDSSVQRSSMAGVVSVKAMFRQLTHGSFQSVQGRKSSVTATVADCSSKCRGW
jgi:hypothetical protein